MILIIAATNGHQQHFFSFSLNFYAKFKEVKEKAFSKAEN